MFVNIIFNVEGEEEEDEDGEEEDFDDEDDDDEDEDEVEGEEDDESGDDEVTVDLFFSAGLGTLQHELMGLFGLGGRLRSGWRSR